MFKCYYCGHNAGEVLATRDGMRFRCFGENKKILRCLKCDLVQLFPQWSDESLDKLYSNYSEKQDFKGQKRKVKISKYLKKYMNKGDNILEVGCGHGDNVRYLKNKGFCVTGIDKDPSVCNGKNIFYCDVTGTVTGWSFNRAQESDTTFNVIYAIHLIEHLVDPVKFINWVIGNLKFRGRFIFEVPCVEDPLLKLYNINDFKTFYWYPYHLFFYSKKTAEVMFGAKVIRRQEYGLINHLRWLIFRRPGNINWHIPILDDIYKFVLMRMGYSDTLVIVNV